MEKNWRENRRGAQSTRSLGATVSQSRLCRKDCRRRCRRCRRRRRRHRRRRRGSYSSERLQRWEATMGGNRATDLEPGQPLTNQWEATVVRGFSGGLTGPPISDLGMY